MEPARLGVHPVRVTSNASALQLSADAWHGCPRRSSARDTGGATVVASLIGTHLSPTSRSDWPVTEFVRTVALSDVVVW